MPYAFQTKNRGQKNGVKTKNQRFYCFLQIYRMLFQTLFIAKFPMHLIEYFLRHFCTRFDFYQQTCGSITRNVKSSIHASYFIYFSIKLYLPTTLQNKNKLIQKKKTHSFECVFFWKPASTYPPEPCPRHNSPLLLAIKIPCFLSICILHFTKITILVIHIPEMFLCLRLPSIAPLYKRLHLIDLLMHKLGRTTAIRYNPDYPLCFHYCSLL